MRRATGSWYTSTKELQLESLEFRLQKPSDLALESRLKNPTQAACRCGCSPPAPAATVWDARATTKSAPRDLGHPDSSGIEKPDVFNDGRGLPEFVRAFGDSLEALAWPRRLKTVGFPTMHHLNSSSA
ncbi:unnamed protein product [Ectocarpus sp. 12 AP-2014]